MGDTTFLAQAEEKRSWGNNGNMTIEEEEDPVPVMLGFLSSLRQKRASRSWKLAQP